MAKIVCGFGASHGPLLSTPPDKWDLRAADDRKNPRHPFRGGVYTFEELVKVRQGEKDFIKEMELEAKRRHWERNNRALGILADKLEEIAPDICVVVGDDQHEWFYEDIQPAFTVYCADQVINTKIDPEKAATKSPGIVLAMSANQPPEDQAYPVPKELAEAIIERAIDDEFDVAVSMKQRAKANGSPIGIGHAVGFIYRRILKDKPIPCVPILLNTYFEPNQPTPKRCYQFGQSIGRAIRDWSGSNANKRVAICASGGISHFVIDEDFDMRMLNAIRDRDTKTIFAEPNSMFRSGTSETKNWITVAGILSESSLQMNLVDYVPSYRSEGGTGCGMAFAIWE